MNNGLDEEDDFLIIDQEIDKLLKNILEDGLAISQSNLDNDKPNPDVLLNLLTPEMIKYLQEHAEESTAFYLLLFNSCISLIIKQLDTNNFDESILARCLSVPGSNNYLNSHTGMQFSINTIQERITEKKRSLNTSEQSQITESPTTKVTLAEKPALTKKHSTKFFNKLLSHTGLSLSKKLQVQNAFGKWKKSAPAKTDNLLNWYKKTLEKHREQYVQMGVSPHFLDELAIQIPSLSMLIVDIAKIPEYFSKNLDPNHKIWNKALNLLKKFEDQVSVANRCIALIDNLKAIFIDQSKGIDSTDKEKLITSINRIGSLTENYRSRKESYITYKHIIKQKQKESDYHEDENADSMMFDYFVIELKKLVQFYNAKKDKVKLGLGGIKEERKQLAENLPLLWETFSFNILPLFIHIEEPIKTDPDQVLSSHYQKEYAQLYPVIKNMKEECQQYLIEARKRNIILKSETQPQESTDLMQNKIKFHQASFELSHRFANFQSEQKKLNKQVKKEIRVLLDTSNKLLAKREINVDASRKQSLQPSPSPKMISHHRKLHSDPIAGDYRVRFYAKTKEHESKEKPFDKRKQETKALASEVDITMMFQDLQRYFNKYEALKDKMMRLLVPIEKGYQPLDNENLKKLESLFAALEECYQYIEPKFKQVKSYVISHLKTHNPQLSLSKASMLDKTIILAMQYILSEPDKYFQCENKFDNMRRNHTNLSMRIGELKISQKNTS
ncbi:TPA: hypothetical protein ACTZ8L_002997, partial [Legionella pneumophila]